MTYKEQTIIDRIKDEATKNNFHGYIFYKDCFNIISEVMFGHPYAEHIETKKGYGCGYDKTIGTQEQHEKIKLVVKAMVKKEILFFSKSKTMVKLKEE